MPTAARVASLPGLSLPSQMTICLWTFRFLRRTSQPGYELSLRLPGASVKMRTTISGSASCGTHQAWSGAHSPRVSTTFRLTMSFAPPCQWTRNARLDARSPSEHHGVGDAPAKQPCAGRRVARRPVRARLSTRLRRPRGFSHRRAYPHRDPLAGGERPQSSGIHESGSTPTPRGRGRPQPLPTSLASRVLHKEM